MSAFEVKVIALARSDLSRLNEHLAGYYAEGWQIAAVVPDGLNDTIYLQRECQRPALGRVDWQSE